MCWVGEGSSWVRDLHEVEHGHDRVVLLVLRGVDGNALHRAEGNRLTLRREADDYTSPPQATWCVDLNDRTRPCLKN